MANLSAHAEKNKKKSTYLTCILCTLQTDITIVFYIILTVVHFNGLYELLFPYVVCIVYYFCAK